MSPFCAVSYQIYTRHWIFCSFKTEKEHKLAQKHSGTGDSLFWLAQEKKEKEKEKLLEL